MWCKDNSFGVSGQSPKSGPTNKSRIIICKVEPSKTIDVRVRAQGAYMGANEFPATEIITVPPLLGPIPERAEVR